MPEELAPVGWGWITVAGGVLIVLLMVKLLVVSWRRRRTWILTEATVGKVRTRQPSSAGNDGGTFVNYHYTDRSGQQRMGVDSPWFGKPKRNSKMQVRYDPESPGRSEAVSSIPGELAVVTFGIAVGVAMILMSLAGWMS